MSLPDRDKQKASIDRELTKFSDLIPSVRTVHPPIKKALALIDGSSKSRAAVLLAEELNRKDGTKIDVLCFYSEQHQTDTLLPSKESYEDSFAFAYEHLKSEDFEIKGQVLEDISMFNQILDAILNSGEYDLIIIPSSFIGIKKLEIPNAADESDAKITVMGDIFEFLIGGNDLPLLLVESEKINIERLWTDIGIIVNSHTNLRYCIEKAIQFSNKKALFHAIINLNPQYYEDLASEEFEELCKKQKEEMETFKRANSEVFKDISRFVDFNLLSTNKIKEVKDLLISFGKDIGILVFYLHS
ncbi:MAG: universal stress protein, partial [Candidatus Heimdallarchaeota archaeon]|nr:universal stress protein [Candidatus Heimdallarchaeota archaeon]